MECVGGCFLNCSVHSLGLANGPGTIRLDQAVLDVDTIEDMRPLESPGSSLPVFGQIREGHAIISQDFVYLIRKCRAFQFSRVLGELSRDSRLGQRIDHSLPVKGIYGRMDCLAARRCR